MAYCSFAKFSSPRPAISIYPSVSKSPCVDPDVDLERNGWRTTRLNGGIAATLNQFNIPEAGLILLMALIRSLIWGVPRQTS